MSKKRFLLLHALSWFVLLLKDWLLQWFGSNPVASNSLWRTALIDVSYSLVAIIAFYGAYGLIARPLIRQAERVRIVITKVPLVLGLIILARFLVEFGFLKPVLGFDNYRDNAQFQWTWFVQNAVLYYWSYVVYGLLYGFVEHTFWHREQQGQKERELLQSEVALLRSQVNPHFLFNCLNDIYALALTRPQQAPAALLKLSELLRYALYRSQKRLVPLCEEIHYLQNYLALEHFGQENQACIQATFPSDDSAHQIAPMLLIPFVENALKHGVVNAHEHPIQISLKVQQATLAFGCVNRKRGGFKDATGGIGLANVRRRLNLEYAGRHELAVRNTETDFEVTLTLTL